MILTTSLTKVVALVSIPIVAWPNVEISMLQILWIWELLVIDLHGEGRDFGLGWIGFIVMFQGDVGFLMLQSQTCHSAIQIIVQFFSD